MKKSLMLAIILAVIGLTACTGKNNTAASSGGSSSSAATSQTTQKTESTPALKAGEWPNDEAGNLVSKPSFDYKVKRYLVGEGRKNLTVEFPGAAKEQIQSYLETIHQEVSATYPDARRDSHWDDEDVWGESFSFKNEAGMYTMVSLKWYAEDDAELMIEWVLK
jgi:hypothetical protein